jgi:hypothetical protein
MSATTGSLLRIPGSTVVVLKSGALLEVRRGDLKGSALKDKRTWETRDAWLSAVGASDQEPTLSGKETSCSRGTTGKPDLDKILRWNIPLYTCKLYKKPYVSINIKRYTQEIQKAQQDLANFETTFPTWLTKVCFWTYIQNPDGTFIVRHGSHKDKILTMDDMKEECRKAIQYQLDYATRSIQAYRNFHFELVKENGESEFYRNQRSSGTASIYIERVDLESRQPITPLYVNIKSGLIAYNGKAGYSFEAVGLGGAVVNVYDGSMGHSILRHSERVTL